MSKTAFLISATTPNFFSLNRKKMSKINSIIFGPHCKNGSMMDSSGFLQMRKTQGE